MRLVAPRLGLVRDNLVRRAAIFNILLDDVSLTVSPVFFRHGDAHC